MSGLIDFEYVDPVEVAVVPPSNSSGWKAGLIGFLVAVVLCGLAWLWSQSDFKIPHRDEDKKEQRDTVSVEGAWLYLVNESKAATVNEELTVREAERLVQQYKMAGYRYRDFENEEVVSLVQDARAKNIQGSFVALLKDGKFTHIQAWNDLQSVEAFLK